METSIAEQFLSYNTALIAAATYAILLTLKRVWPWFNNNKTMRRLRPFMDMLVGGTLALVPQVYAAPIALKILMGVVAGSFSAKAHTVVKRTIFGEGVTAADTETKP